MILNWNGASWLERTLPSVVAAASQIGSEIWIVDNDSADDSLNFCQQKFPSVRFEALKVNKVLASYNIAVSRCTTDVVVFLNNDVIVEENFLQPLIAQLTANTEVFAVAPCVRTFPPNSEAQVETEAEIPNWTNGMIRGTRHNATSAAYTWYTHGGAMACDRRKFLELNGFDELYLPGYYEDVDLSWRAWKHGWTCLYEPLSTVYHAGGSSFGRSEKVKTLILRNEFLFHWKNLRSPSFLAGHVVNLIPRLLIAACRGDVVRLKGFIGALNSLDKVFRSRRQVYWQSAIGDAELIRRARAWRGTNVDLPKKS